MNRPITDPVAALLRSGVSLESTLFDDKAMWLVTANGVAHEMDHRPAQEETTVVVGGLLEFAATKACRRNQCNDLTAFFGQSIAKVSEIVEDFATAWERVESFGALAPTEMETALRFIEMGPKVGGWHRLSPGSPEFLLRERFVAYTAEHYERIRTEWIDRIRSTDVRTQLLRRAAVRTAVTVDRVFRPVNVLLPSVQKSQEFSGVQDWASSFGGSSYIAQTMTTTAKHPSRVESLEDLALLQTHVPNMHPIELAQLVDITVKSVDIESDPGVDARPGSSDLVKLATNLWRNALGSAIDDARAAYDERASFYMGEHDLAIVKDDSGRPLDSAARLAQIAYSWRPDSQLSVMPVALARTLGDRVAIIDVGRTSPSPATLEICEVLLNESEESFASVWATAAKLSN